MARGAAGSRPERDSAGSVLPEHTSLRAVIRRVRQLLDLDADPTRIGRQLGRDPRLGHLVGASAGLRLPGAWDGFELAIRAILAETRAETVDSDIAALVRTHGRRLPSPPPDGAEWLFPSPAALCQLDRSYWSGESSAVASARIRRLSEAVLAGAIQFGPESSFDQLMDRLVTFGHLSASGAAWVAMRTLGEPDAPLVSGVENSTSIEWRPWRSYVLMHRIGTPQPVEHVAQQVADRGY